jgi:hypothetical protein
MAKQFFGKALHITKKEEIKKSGLEKLVKSYEECVNSQ